MSKKLSYEQVYDKFLSKGHQLLTPKEKYTGIKQKLKFKCGNCKKITETTAHACMKNKGNCQNCYQETIRRNKIRFTYENVYNYFKSQGCELLENEYIDAKTKMKYRCSCGNISKIKWNDFQQGKRCSKCAKNEPLSYKKVKSLIESTGRILLSKTYESRKRKLSIICRCGEKVEMSLNSILVSKGCMKCTGNNPWKFIDVYNYFKKHNCILLTEHYKNNQQKLKYICSCGNESYINFHRFKDFNNRCKKCMIERMGKTRIKNGTQKSLVELSYYEIYVKNIRRLTEREYKKNKASINPLNYPRGRGKYHLDHMYSISEGFKNNIPPFILSHSSNLRMIPEYENYSKNKKSSISLEELYENFFK